MYEHIEHQMQPKRCREGRLLVPLRLMSTRVLTGAYHPVPTDQ